MEQKQTRLFHKTLSILWSRVLALSVFSFVAAAVGAQTLSVDGTTVTKACVGEPIVLTGSGFTRVDPDRLIAADVYVSYDGVSWANANVTATEDPATHLIKCVLDMGNREARYYMVNQQNPGQKTNTVTVSVSNDCEAVCHVTSTGDYFLGTDFNPANPNQGINWSTTPPGNLISYFQDNNIRFWRFNGGGNGSVERNWTYAGQVPYKDRNPKVDPYNNYYYVFRPNDCSDGTPFKLGFPRRDFANKYYRFVMRLYVDLSECSDRSSLDRAMMNIRTDFGNDSYNAIDIEVYNDANNQQIGTYSYARRGHLDNTIIGNGQRSVLATASNVKYFRIEVTFYGQFLGNQTEFVLYPQFQQWSNSCAKVAIDYISAEVESICMDNGAVCKDDNAVINAAGFPKDATYVWEVQENGRWQSVTVGGFAGQYQGKQRVEILVTSVGKTNYRVRANGTHGDGKPYEVIIPFTVTGKDCDPVQPTDIQLPTDPFCVPNDREDGMFSVYPLDADRQVGYTWSFTTPRGETFGSDKLSFSGGDLIEDKRGGKVNLVLNAEAEEGTYTVTVQPFKEIVDSTQRPPKIYKDLRGKAISSTFNVYRTPQIQVIKEGTDPLHQSEVELCPTDRNQTVVAIANRKDGFSSIYQNDYVYTWNNGAKGQTNSATVDFPALGSCNGSYKNHKVSVTVQIRNVGCPTTVEQSWKLGKIEKPTIDCSSLPDLDNYVLGVKEKTKSIELDFPDYTAGCETDPLLRIELHYVPKSGSNIDKTFEARKSKFDRLNRTVELPAGAGSVVYTVIDGCDNAAFCTKTIKVQDVTPPNVKCEDIPSYETRLTIQDGCEAKPGYDEVTLPTISAPKLLDQNGVDGTITGVYKGRAYNPVTEPSTTNPNFSLFDTRVGLNDNYKVGTTYILWEFTDASGNSAYCLQPIHVIDDHKPQVFCPSNSIGDVSNKPGYCGLSMNALIAQLKELPSAKGLCSDSTIVYQPVFFYRNVADPDLEEVPTSKFDDIIFDIDETYEVVWRFYKNNDRSTGIYEDCAREFTVRDTESPSFDCSSLETVRVTANSYKPLNKGFEYLDYASKDSVVIKEGVGPAATSVTYKGTLATAFESGIIRLISPSEVVDNCDGDIIVDVTLTGPNERGEEKTEKIRNLKQLEDHKFYVGLTTIDFRFIDESNNEATCSQSIIVTAGTTPIPDSCPKDLTLYADENCKTVFKLEKTTMPTAKIPVNQEGLWFNFRYKVIEGLHFDEECSVAMQYFPNNLTGLNGVHSATIEGKTQQFNIDYLCEQYLNDWDKFKDSEHNTWNAWSDAYAPADPKEKILSSSDKLTTVVEYTGYPYEVEMFDSTGNSIALVENPYRNDDIAPERVIYTRYYGGSGNAHECNNFFHTCKYADIKMKNNFDNVVLNQTLTKGVYTVVYRFQNEKGGLQRDSCVQYITVVDTIPPILDCGDWNKSGTFPANEECVTPVEEILWFKKPTVADLKVRDNCSVDPNDFTITWNRNWNHYNISAESALTDPLGIGVTTMTWYVADASGNVSTCEQVITVEDVTGPVVDCSLLKDIVVETETNCEASAKTVQAAGLDIPYALDDKCSPTGKPIPGEGTRSDGKDVFNDPYPRGATVITWVFKDAKGNESVCKQNVVVEDRTAPVFENCFKMPEVVINLSPDECTASQSKVKASLGTQTAIDDCDGDIAGVPYVLSPDGASLLNLYDSFQKDTTYTIIWVFVDLSGNAIECSQKLTIVDTTPPDPSGVCPPPTKEVSAKTVCSVTYDELQLPTLEQMKMNDPCDGVLYPTVVAKVVLPDGVTLVYYNDELKDVTYPVGTHTFLWIYEDKGGNLDTCTMLLTVNDSILPVLEDCDVDPEIHLTVDGDICAIDPANVKIYLREPKAYDECDDYRSGLGLTWMTPVVERFFIDSTIVIGAAGDTLGYRYDSTRVADGVTKKWDEDVFPKGKTMLRWTFTDQSGNQVFCEKSVTVHDFTPPYFDCDKIDPDTLRPEAYKGDCEVEFGNLRRDVLDKLAYKAWDACAGDSVPGVLTLNGNMELPEEYTMSVGITYKLLWLFIDEDGNKTTCPQYILPSHLNDIDFDCNTIKDTVAYAQEGECAITADSLRLWTPVALDSCAVLSGFGGEFEAIGFRSDSLSMTAPFPTGYTQIKWMFVSPWNLHDTLWCDQKVTILGNKHFDLNCDELTPTRRDTLDDCGPTDPLTFVIDTPRVADPCIVDENDPEYWRVGVGVRSDNKPLNAAFNLGYTTIQWTFTDFTKAITDTCVQSVEVRTSLDMIFDCDALNKDTIKVDVKEGECTVDASKVKEKIKRPFALHPCPAESGVDTIWGVPSRKFGMSMDSAFYIGLSEIVWTFVDPSHTLVNDSVTCSQWVRVGDVNEMPVKCENFPDMVFRLSPDDCEISWKEMNINVPGIVDLCSHNIIDPVVTRSSGKSLTAVTSVVGKDTIVAVTAEDFTVGIDTVRWTYSFQGQLFVCDQVITVKDSMAPLYDCKNLEPIVVPAVPGKCYVNAKAVFDSLPNPWPQAEDACNQQKIDGRVYMEDGQELTKASSFLVPVGEHILTWIFIDETINELADTCSQRLVVMGDQAPIFNCESLQHDPILVEGCDTTLDNTYITTPYALDACTNDSVKGVGRRLDGGKLYGVYPVGTTSIEWVFISPFSTLADTCIQDITVLTKQELDLHCTDVNGDTIAVDVAEGECFTSVKLETPYALHPCPEQSGVQKIMGVPYRSDGRQIADSFRTGVTVVTWVFTDNSGTMYKNVDTCYTVVQVGDINKMPVDCKNMPDTTIILPATDCEISWKEINFSVPDVRDLCSDSLITPTLTRWSGKDMGESFTVGPDTIYWNYNFFGQVVTCAQGVLVLDSVAPAFDCSTLKDTVLVAKPGLCDVSSEELKLFLGDPVAIDSCTNAEVHGRAYVCNVLSPDGTSASPSADGGCLSVDKVSVKVGDILSIHWIFQDSLLNAVAKECDQTVSVKGTAEPVFDCSALKDTVLYLELDQCELPTGKLTLNVPVAKDSCTGTDVPGVGVRRDNMALMDRYPKGVTVVDWTFTSPYSVTAKTCPQNVVVKDTFPPQFLCETLKDTLKVRITMTSVSETEVSYDEVVAVGLEIPSIKDACDGLLVAEGTRSDGKDLKDNFSLGDPVTITWTFRDSSGNERICSQVVLVEDWLIEDLICPSDLDGKVFSCIDEIPEPYATYAEFKAAGGYFTNETKMLENTFHYENRYEGDSCEMVYTRTYHMEDFRHNDIYCQQIVTVKDTSAPQIIVGAVHDTVLSCTQDIFPAVTLSAVDNCDPNPTVTVTETNNRGKDPSACDYSNYEIFRKYVAVDRCGNESEYVQTISIRDTTGPTFSIPEGWRDSILAKNFKSCIFGVPDMTIDARDIVSDDCTESNNITILQIPEAGTHIDRSTTVWIYAIDKCGNKDSLSRFVIVQQPATIVSLEAYDMDTCLSQDLMLSLSTQNVRFARGFILDQMRTGKIRQLPSVFSYDYYKGDSVDEKNLMFSDNPYTYRYRFDAAISRYGSVEKAQRALIALSKKSQSGYYTFVAMDTTTGCSDTATAYINIAEKPRVRLNSAVLSECEGNLLDLAPYLKCESDMGATATASYWTFDGKTPFEAEDSVMGKLLRFHNGASLQYVMENRCGSTSSLGSLFLLCDGDDFGGKTKEDSVKFFGSVDKYELFKQDRLFVYDSILLDVHKRYQPDSILVETDPSNPVRIWRGETVTLKLKTGYDFLSTEWYRVVGRFDREFYDNMTSNYDYNFFYDSTRIELGDEEDENLFSGTAENSYIEDTPMDTSLYYVVINDGVCPSAASSLIQVDVITRIPTAFTPYHKDGLNDYFMERHPVTIYDRYGQKVFVGKNGWDGTHKGHMADPGVYFYEVVMIDGSIMKGTVEVVKIK